MSPDHSSQAPASTATERRFWLTGVLEYVGMLLVIAALVLIFSSLSDRFLNLRTATTIANQIPDLTLVAVGMTFVLVIGGIDLSVGSVLALSAAVLGVVMVDWQWPLWTAALACLGAGLLCGVLNGAVIVGAGIPSFIVTLGMLEIARGGAYLVTQSQTKYIGAAVEPLATPLPGVGVSTAFVIAVIAVCIGQFVLNRMVFGRYCIAIGANERAVKMSGIDSRPTRIIVFALSGLCAALGGVFHTARLASADPNAGVGLELAAIAAVVIGGTSLMGGRGSVTRTFLGVLIIAILQTGLAQVGATEPFKRLITGAVIVLAVVIDAWRHRLPIQPWAGISRLWSRSPTADKG